VIPVVAECDDSRLSDAVPVRVEPGDAGRALDAALAAAGHGAPVEHGAVGAGTGIVCFGSKRGIETSSRGVPELGATVGVLVIANFRAGPPLRLGAVGGRRATDVPLAPAQLTRVAHRAGLGLARTGSVAHHGSGEIFFAFAAAGGGGERGARTVSIRDAALDPVFASAVEATEGRCSMRCGGPRTCWDATVRS
jgi:D-aminopeptidase